MSIIPRYLTHFNPKVDAHYFTDVLVIGGGLAGMRAAVEIDASLTVLVVTKDAWTESNSNYAQGGIAGVIDPSDSFQEHVDDTLAAGGPLCDREVVEMVIEDAPHRIHELINWGTVFDSGDTGELLLGREGGHGRNRILHAFGDATGREIMRAVIEHVTGLPNVRMWKDTFTLDLLVDEGVCRGAIAWNNGRGKTYVWAKQTVLCTGGAGQVYRETTNPPVATGDGHAMAYRAGAQLRDMEFMQFHPTVLYIAGSSRSLITEAMRGEGARLIDAFGKRFMPGYDDRAELAPRDVVAQAIVSQMEITRRPHVYLDLSHLDPDFVRKRFPGIVSICQEFGIDIATDPIPVRPGAHYLVGGVKIDSEGRTTLPGLLAAGEVTSSGLHGANRLASNSLLEGLVFGRLAGAAACRAAAEMPDNLTALAIGNEQAPQPSEPLDVADIRNSLKSLMWRAAGVRRTQSGLEDAISSIESWCHYVLARQFADSEGWELQNMLVVAHMMICAAREREESRGVHLRSDFPETDDDHWCRHIELRRDTAGV